MPDSDETEQHSAQQAELNQWKTGTRRILASLEAVPRGTPTLGRAGLDEMAEQLKDTRLV